LIELEGTYSHPAFGDWIVTPSLVEGQIYATHGIKKCNSTFRDGDIFVLSCRAPHILQSQQVTVQFTRDIDGPVTLLHVKQYEPSMPPIGFTKSTFKPEVVPYPRFVPS